ncbi:MAG TPA: DUF4446 family protein [Symbiobacteriaceae bacterium]|nr:DUF4446 family protein [Symbiobacteriaceae bacterium]
MDASALDQMLIALIAASVALIALIVTIITSIRQGKLLKRYRLLLSNGTNQDMEQLILSQGAAIEQLQSDLLHLQRRVDTMGAEAKLHVQRVGMVRFCAFPDTGSDLSFAIAMLDANDNGVVVSSLYGRSESRTYAKPIQAGKSTYQLSDEEKEAIAKAMGQGKADGKSR